MMYPNSQMKKELTPTKETLKVYLLPEQGVSVEATSAVEAVTKGKKSKENK